MELDSDLAATLEKIDLAVQAVITDKSLTAVKASPAWLDRIPNLMATSITKSVEVPGQRMFHETFPADWWSHFKDAKFPKWAKEKWPPKYKVVSVSALYPKLAINDADVSWRVEMRDLWK